MAKNKPIIQNITSQDEIGLEICTAQVFYQSETEADTAIKTQLGQQHRFEHFVWIWVQQGGMPARFGFCRDGAANW